MLKKSLIIFLSVFFLVAPLNPAFAAQPIKVTVDGFKLDFDVSPILENGRVLVPLRAIFEELGAQVNWDDSSKKITATKDNKTVSLVVGEKTAYVDEKPVKLDVPARIIRGNTLVPVRFISEAFGSEVIWKQDSRFVAIRTRPSLTWYKNEEVLEYIDAGPTRVPFNVNLYCKSGSKSEYERGQDIIFEVEVLNSTTAYYYQTGQQSLTVKCYTPTIIVQTQKQYSENIKSYILKKTLPTIKDQLIKPGESYSIRWVWDQTDSSGKMVPPRDYIVTIVNDINNPETGLSFIGVDGNQHIQTDLTPIPFRWHWVKIVSE